MIGEINGWQLAFAVAVIAIGVTIYNSIEVSNMSPEQRRTKAYADCVNRMSTEKEICKQLAFNIGCK